MKDLSLKHIYKNWKKLWPLTLVLLIIGVGIGVYVFISSTQAKAEVESKILVMNMTTCLVDSNDYYYILDNVLSKKDESFEACSATMSQTGNILAVSTICGNSEEDAKAYAKSILIDFDKSMRDIYGEEAIQIKTIKDPSLKKTVKPGLIDTIASLFIPILAAIVVSIIVAIATV